MAFAEKKALNLSKRGRKSKKTNGHRAAASAGKPSKARKSKNKVLEASISTIVTGAMLGLQTAGKDSERPPLAFRVSSFPFCSLIGALSPFDNTDIYREHYYFEIGTAMHTLIQTWMARSLNGAKMWGDWECGCERKWNAKEKKFEPIHSKKHCCKPAKKCPGGKEWRYAEVELAYKNLTGHVDTIFRIPGGYINGKKQKPWFLVIDYKTTSFEKKGKNGTFRLLTKEEREDKYPIPANVVQISSYCALLTKVLGINVQGWALVYVDRSKPIRRDTDLHVVPRAWTPTKQALWMQRIDDACEAAPFALKAVELRQQGKPLPKPLIVDMVKRRPCRTERDHDTYMAAEFHYEDTKECPHKGICCSGKGSDKQVLQLFKKLLADEEAIRAFSDKPRAEYRI